MLAFRPGNNSSGGGGGGSAPAPSAPPVNTARPASAATASTPVAKLSASAPASTSAPAPAAKSAPAPAASKPVASAPLSAAATPVGNSADRPDWHSLMRQLPVKGMVQQLAFQTELQDWVDAAAGVRATIVTPMPQLASEASIGRLADALTAHFGKPVKILIEKGEVEGKTVAKVDAQVHQEKRMNAEQMIAADPFIQQLEKEFGAKVVGGSVKPL